MSRMTPSDQAWRGLAAGLAPVVPAWQVLDLWCRNQDLRRFLRLLQAEVERRGDMAGAAMLEGVARRAERIGEGRASDQAELGR